MFDVLEMIYLRLAKLFAKNGYLDASGDAMPPDDAAISLRGKLESVLAFTALQVEFGWGRHRIDSKLYTRHLEKEGKNVIEKTIEEVGLLN